MLVSYILPNFEVQIQRRTKFTKADFKLLKNITNNKFILKTSVLRVDSKVFETIIKVLFLLILK